MTLRFDLLAPELTLMAFILAVFCQTLFSRSQPRAGVWMPYAAFVTCVAAASSLGAEGLEFYGAYRIDALSQFFKFAIAVGLFIASVLTSRNPGLFPMAGDSR